MRLGFFLRAALITTVFAFVSSAAVALELPERASLQAVLERHIDQLMVDGAVLQINLETGAVRHLHPVSTHPIIVKMGAYFVLCYDFRDDAGRQVQVDYYLAQREESFVVFHTSFGEREALTKLLKAGKARRAS